jgi:hypothetical protein
MTKCHFDAAKRRLVVTSISSLRQQVNAMTISRKVAAAVVLMAAAIPFTTAEAGEKLSAAELAALFPGHFEAIWKDKHQVRIVVDGDGEVRGSSGILSDSGRWSIDGDRLCVAFSWWTRDRTRCTEVLRHGDWYVGMISGKGKPRVRFRPQ